MKEKKENSPTETFFPDLSDERELTSLLSYELRTPLTSIRGVLGLLLSGEFGSLSETGQHLLKIAMHNTDRLMRLAEAIEHEIDPPASILSTEEIERFQLETDLLLAWEHQEFELFYQPLVSLEDGATIGFEALVRWQHPTRGCISPAVFIPCAEKIGSIDQLGLWVLHQACSQLKVWQEQFPQKPPLTVSVNVSSVQLSQSDLPDRIREICKDTGIAPGSLRLEITESSSIENSERAMTSLEQLKAMGIQLYLDDFGTGYSSLSRLQDLRVDVLKIDRSFVSQKKWEVIWSIILLAESLGLEVIAEGVETTDDLEKLRLLGCKRVQGFLFSEPINAQEATDWIGTPFAH
ncbi:EAL domain-containing protein [Oscillatoriales cyanobacterium LEGE 11467]|uniref:histidine kinase n=2 Tax=Zarconia TaxID=2992130 RepID=A0A928VWH2_9CYAN|nr:EAL domain-containing protein [Zarconia navalis LEGE 11467]